jgi:hypothetical protein
MKHIIKASWALLACCAVLIPATSSVSANTNMHGSTCKPRSATEAAKNVYSINETGFEASGALQITCPVSVNNITHTNTNWDISIERLGPGTVSCTGRILNAAGELVAAISDSDSGVGEILLSNTWTNPVSVSHSYAFVCTTPNAITKIESMGVF